MTKLEVELNKILTKKKLTIAVAESCTGGLLAHRITNVSGSSVYFKCGIVTYSDTAKSKLLGIPLKVIKEKNAVSIEVCKLMAKNVKKICKTDIGVGITGYAGHTGGKKNIPIGLVYICVEICDFSVCEKYNFVGDREKIKYIATETALQMILKIMTNLIA